jgi:hypothetical protein
MLKSRFPDKAVELMIIANRIPPERKIACEHHDIDAIEIPQKKFRDIAEEVGYVFKSEIAATTQALQTDLPRADVPKWPSLDRHEDFGRGPTKVEKGWYYWEGKNGRGYFLAFVNAKGSCSMRRFEADGGAFLGKEYKSGDFQDTFADYLKSAVPLYVSRQPNLERDCKNRLPSFILSELRQQTQGKTR